MTWITLYPHWYVEERQAMARHYPEFRLDQQALDRGILCYYGELIVRPPGGAQRFPIWFLYPEGAPSMPPVVIPLESMPEFDESGKVQRIPSPRWFDHRHQMPNGALCLFQRQARGSTGGDIVRGIDTLKRAQQWFLGHCTGHWPADSAESELEAHFEPRADVLLSAVFFDPDIEGCGCFYMVPDLRRLVESEHLCPMIMVSLTEETTICKVLGAREELSRIYPWIRSELWEPTQIVELEKGIKPGEIVQGHWWSLSEEPKPFRDGRGLLRALAAVAPDQDAWRMVSLALNSKLVSAAGRFFGLRYPGRQEDVEWLILWVPPGKTDYEARTQAQKRTEFEQERIFCLRTHAARPKDLHLRNTSVVDASVQDKTVALIGLGALGSTVAELLAKAGVGHFRLCDSDYLATGNVARHVGGLDEFGAPKTQVVTRRLLEINPYLNFSEADVLTGSAIASLERLAALIKPADITISTTADESVESIINQIAVINHKTVLYGRSLRRSNMGRVFLVRPGVDACKECLAEYARNGRQGRPVPADWIEVTESEDDILLHECGRPVIPASAVDMAFVASLVGRVALDLLEGNDTDRNHWLWSQQPVPELDRRLDREMQTFSGHLEPRYRCSACQEPDVAQLVLSQKAYETIVSATESSLRVETGGILIGFVDGNRRAVVLRATGPGPDAQRTGARFDRDVDFVQAELDKAATELGDHGVYLGEWHSHLMQDPQPSPLDIESLFGISAAPNYLTRCPVMVIAGVDPTTGRTTAVNTWAFPLAGRMYEIENSVDSKGV